MGAIILVYRTIQSMPVYDVTLRVDTSVDRRDKNLRLQASRQLWTNDTFRLIPQICGAFFKSVRAVPPKAVGWFGDLTCVTPLATIHLLVNVL
jgi:hypothetical protein